MEIAPFLELIDQWLVEQEKSVLTNPQKAIIKGTLENWTYEKMTISESALKGYNVSYISRYMAHHLWPILTECFQIKQILNEGEKVRKSNLWDYIDRIQNKGYLTNDTPHIEVFPPEDTLLDTTLLQRYRITADLVKNDFSKTYLGEDIGFSSPIPCIIKQFISQSEEITQRFKRESWSLQQLNQHPQIPNLLADFEHEGYYYVVYQFIEGDFLSQRLIDEEIWTEGEVINFLRNILSVLDFVHQNNIIHREINPDNLILRNSDKNIVLIGFAGVKIITAGEQTVTLNANNQGYISPEQAVGVPRPSSDIYSIGKIALQALTGRHPRRIRKYDINTLNPLWREYISVNITSSFAEIIDKMVCFDCQKRYGSAKEVLQALEQL